MLCVSLKTFLGRIIRPKVPSSSIFRSKIVFKWYFDEVIFQTVFCFLDKQPENYVKPIKFTAHPNRLRQNRFKFICPNLKNNNRRTSQFSADICYTYTKKWYFSLGFILDSMMQSFCCYFYTSLKF